MVMSLNFTDTYHIITQVLSKKGGPVASKKLCYSGINIIEGRSIKKERKKKDGRPKN
jgi:hypothetical protein